VRAAGCMPGAASWALACQWESNDGRAWVMDSTCEREDSGRELRRCFAQAAIYFCQCGEAQMWPSVSRTRKHKPSGQPSLCVVALSPRTTTSRARTQPCWTRLRS
jgi:hypothetical protein